MTNQQVYDTIMSKDAEIDYRAYCAKGSTVGYTYPKVKWVKVNTCHSNFKSDRLVAQNIIHETLHKKGFIHSQRWTSKRPYSVPYGIGDIVKDLY